MPDSPALTPESVLAQEALTPREAALFRERLMLLLERQMKLKTQGDSASLREEEAQELLSSVVFTLQLHLKTRHLPLQAALSGDILALFSDAQRTLMAYVSETEALFHTVHRDVQTFGSRALYDTIKGIGASLHAYDARLYAHHIPGMIDYPLCLPVEETLQGIVYLREYLRRLLMENSLLTRFSPTRVSALLSRACPEYRDLIVNLYEPVAATVVGLSLLSGGETLLEITPAQARRLSGQLTALAPTDARAKLSSAAYSACTHLHLEYPDEQVYLARTAEALLPRLLVGSEAANGVFSVCDAEGL